MPPTTPLSVLLGFDGLVCGSDLPVQAFARHCAAALPIDRGRVLIGGMRGFLEDRPELIPAGLPLDAADDGFEAVAMLAAALHLDTATVRRARAAARADLAASAWVVDAAPGLPELLAALAPIATVQVIAQDRLGVDEVLASTGLGAAVAGVLVAPTPGAALSGPTDALDEPGRVAVLSTRWADLATAHDMGCRTGLVDRRGRIRGTPTWRAGTVDDLAKPLLDWARRAAGAVA